MSGEEICQIINRHVEDCGEPPNFSLEDYDYVSYFENSQREQSIFLYDAEEEVVVVYIGDAGWNQPQVIPAQNIVNGSLPDDEDNGGVLPDSSEKKWLLACKSAVIRRISTE